MSRVESECTFQFREIRLWLVVGSSHICLLSSALEYSCYVFILFLSLAGRNNPHASMRPMKKNMFVSVRHHNMPSLDISSLGSLLTAHMFWLFCDWWFHGQPLLELNGSIRNHDKSCTASHFPIEWMLKTIRPIWTKNRFPYDFLPSHPPFIATAAMSLRSGRSVSSQSWWRRVRVGSLGLQMLWRCLKMVKRS